MSLVADALQPFLVKGLINQKRPSEMTLADLIGRQETIGFDLDFDNINKSICFDFRDARDIVGSVASDISRLASASFQTIRSIPNEFTEKEAIPWAVIRTYYAAFYAGQALIRLFGESCSYFDREQIARISELGKICDKTPEFRLTKSVYHRHPPDAGLVDAELAGFDGFWQCQTLDTGLSCSQPVTLARRAPKTPNLL